MNIIFCSCEKCLFLPMQAREKLHHGDKVVCIDKVQSAMIMIIGDGCEELFELRKANKYELEAGRRL